MKPMLMVIQSQELNYPFEEKSYLIWISLITFSSSSCLKNPAYRRHQLSRPMQIVGPKQIWRGCVIFFLPLFCFVLPMVDQWEASNWSCDHRAIGPIPKIIQWVQRKDCLKRHRRQCQFGGRFRRNHKDKSCEFSHSDIDTSIKRVTNQMR